MFEIRTKEDFEKCLELEKAIVFIFFEWSGQAHFSENTLLNWMKTTKFTDIPLYKLNPEVCEFAESWVYLIAKDSTGYGSLSWLMNSSIKHFESNIGNLSLVEIEEITEKFFKP
jgi:hypothetical protein